MPIHFSALMCHAPIVLPAVGGDEAHRCRGTTRAMRDVAARAVASRPERLVLISPHTPRHRARWSARPGPHRGDLGRFRAPQIRLDLPDAPEVAEHLDLPPTAEGEPLDHGASVPLAFLVEQGWSGPTAILAPPWDASGATALGRALRDLSGRTAVIASGDMSHRLIEGAPAGYHPDAAAFDEAFVTALEQGDTATALDPPHRTIAAEDVVTSTAVALAAADASGPADVLHYEGPWGVGYCEAVFLDPEPPLWAIARAAVAAAAEGRPAPIPAGGPAAAGVFVSLHLDGRLRGCIGHIRPTTSRLWHEVAVVARLAALEDPRFEPVAPDEAPLLDIEVSVLEPPEACTADELDPERFGLIVEHVDGRRALLLPGVVDTVSEQLRVTRHKAGIGSDEPVRLSRFPVTTSERP